jgi:TPR repeat protein
VEAIEIGAGIPGDARVSSSVDAAIGREHVPIAVRVPERHERIGDDLARVVQQDYSQAMKWYRLSVKRGNPIALNSIGAMYEEGLGVQQDYTEAVKWYRQAADQG